MSARAAAATLAPPQVVVVESSAIKTAAAWAARTLPTRPPVPVLAGLMIEMADGALTMSAFDYETFARVDVDAAGSFDSPLLVSGRMFADAVARLHGEARLEVTGSVLSITAGRQSFRLHLMDASEYPRPPKAAPVSGGADAEDLRELLDRAATAAAKVKDSDLNLNSLRLIAADGTLTAYGTNRYMVARVRIPWDGDAFEALVPAAALTGAVRGMAGPVQVGANASHLTLASADRTATVSLTAGEYAQVERVMDGTPLSEKSVHVDRAELADAVASSRISIDRGKPLALAFEPGSLDVSGDGDTSQAQGLLDAVGDVEMTLHVNPEYFGDLIGATPGPRVHITPGTAPTKPFRLSGADADGEPIADATFLLVPINMNRAFR